MESFVKIKKVVPGMQLKADGGFTCIREGAVVTVTKDPLRKGFAALYVPCRCGQHYLDGQIKGDCLTGLTEVSAPAK